jgi:aryl-alcohol dehydrogenase-like predicted oxidoreductase
VALGRTGLTVSRLAMGSGTHGSGGTSEQTRLGIQAYARLLVQSYHEQGLNFWETADGYGSHRHVGEAIRQVGRDKVVVLTKSKANTAAEMQADLDRFRRELGVEQIDVVLLHAVTNGNWTQSLAGAMDALSMAKQRGIIRAHGISCHSLSALRLAARTPWVDVDLARINPARIEMDSDPATVISVLRDPALHEEVCARIGSWVNAQPGWSVAGIAESPITGPEGNKEFLLVARKTASLAF